MIITANIKARGYVNPAKGVFHCYGCGVGGDVFKFVQLLHQCSFRASVEILATRAGIDIQGFKPSPELTAKVAALKAERQKQMDFERFCNDRIQAVNRKHRDLGRAASHAEEYLRSGLRDPYIDDAAWTALEWFRLFEARIEREGLCDLEVLRTEWRRKGVPA